jgi:hypothetical protein
MPNSFFVTGKMYRLTVAIRRQEIRSLRDQGATMRVAKTLNQQAGRAVALPSASNHPLTRPAPQAARFPR